MTVAEITALFEYDAWATHRLFDAMAALTPEQRRYQFAGPTTSVLSPAGHMLTSINRWCARVMGEDWRSLHPPSLTSHTDLMAYEVQVRQQVRRCLAGLSDERLAEVQEFRFPIDMCRTTRGEVLRDITNHSTYHRGQIATLLTLWSVEYPDTDYMYWLASRGS